MDDRVWFDEVYRQYADLLFRIGRRLIAANTDESALYDMMQDVFLTLWNRRETLKTHPNIGGWLVEAMKFRIRGEQAKISRRSLRHAYSLDAEDAAPLPGNAFSPEEEAQMNAHRDAIASLLGEEGAQLFLDYTLGGYTAQALSERTGLTPSGIWMRIARMKKKLAAHPEIFYVLLAMMIGFDI